MDVNVYDDVPNFDLGEEVEKLKCENRMLMDHIQSLEEDIEKLTGTIVKLKETQDNLTKNISSLFVTAKTEIERKDRMITDLRTEIDNMCFRRRNPDVDYKRKERENTASEINITKRFKHDRREDNDQGWHGSQQRYSPDRFSNASNRSRSRSRDRVDRYRDESINTYSDRNRNDYDTDRFDGRGKRFYDWRYAEAPRYPEKNFGYGDLRNERTRSLERPTHVRQQSPVTHHKDEAIHKSNEGSRPSSRGSSVERGTETFPYARYVPRQLPSENKALDKTAHTEQKADKLGHTTNTNKPQPIKKRLKMLDVVEEKVKKMKSTPVKLNNSGGTARETKNAPNKDAKVASKNLLASKTFIPGKSGKSSLSPNKIIRTTGPLTKRRESISDGSKNITKAKKPQLKAGNSEGNISSNAVDNSLKTSVRDSSFSNSVREKGSSTEIVNSKTHSKERKGSDEQLPRKPCVEEEIEQYIIIDSDEEESTDSNADQIRAVAASIVEKANKEKTETDIEFKETLNSNVTKDDEKDRTNKTSDEDKNCKSGVEEFDKEQKEYVESMEDIRCAREFEAEEKRTAKAEDVNNIRGSYENRENQVGTQFNAQSMKSDIKVDATEEKEESDGATLKEEGNKTANVTVDAKEKEADSQSQNGEKKELRSEQNTNSTATSCDKMNVEIGQKMIDDTATHAENEITNNAEVGEDLDKVVPSHKDEENKPNKECNRKHKSVGIQQETSYQPLEREEAGKEELKKGTTASTNISKEERNIKKKLDDEYKQDVILEQKVNDDVVVVGKEEEKEESSNMRNIKLKDDKTIDNTQFGVEGKRGVDCNVAATGERDEKEDDSKGKARAELSENDEDVVDSLRNKEKKMEIDQRIREERQGGTEPKKALQTCVIEDKKDKSDVKKTAHKTVDDGKKKKEDMLTARISKKEGELKQMVDKSGHDNNSTSKQPNKSSEKVAGICNTGSKNTKPVKADTILGPKKNTDFVVENRKTERKEMDNQPKKDSTKKLEKKLSQVDVVRQCRSEGTKPEKRRLSSASSTSPNANIPTESFKEGVKKFKSVSDDSTNSTKQTGGSTTRETLQKEDDVKTSSRDNSKSAVKENISSKRSSSKDKTKDSKSETAKTKQEKIEKKDVEKLAKGNATKDNAITDPAPVKTAVNQDVQEIIKTGSIRTAKEEKCEIKEGSVKNDIQRDERISTIEAVNRNNSPVRTISSRALVKEKTQELKKSEVENLEKKEPSSKKNVQKDIRLSTEGRSKDKRSNDHTELPETSMKENIADAKKIKVEKLEKKELAVKKDTQKDTKPSTEYISKDKTPVSSTMLSKASLKEYIQEARKVRQEKDSQKDPKIGDSSKDNRLTDYVGSFKALENEIMQEMKKTQEEFLEKKVSIAKKTAQKESKLLTQETKNKDDLAIDYTVSTKVLAKENVQETEKTKNEMPAKKGTSTIKGNQKDVPLQGSSTKENRLVGPLMSKSKDNILEMRGTREEPEKKQLTKGVGAQKDTKVPTEGILDNNNSPIDYTMSSKSLGRESLQERKKSEDGRQKKNELNTENTTQRDIPSEGVNSKNNRTMEPLMSKVKAAAPKMRPAKEILEKKQVTVKKDVQKEAKVPAETTKRKSSSPVVQTRVPKILLNDIQHAKKAGLVKKGVGTKKPIQKDTKVPTEGNRSKDRTSVGSLDLKTKQNETRKSPGSKNNSVTTEEKKPEQLGTPKQRKQASKQPELSIGRVAKKSGGTDTLELNEKAKKMETFNRESVKVSKETVITESLNINTKQLAEVAVTEIRDAEKTSEHSTISNKESKMTKKQVSESKTSESVLGNNDRFKQHVKSGKTVHVIDCTIIKKGNPDNTPRGDLLSKTMEGVLDPNKDKIDGTTSFNQAPVKRASDYNLPSTVESPNFERSTYRRETVAENTVPKKTNSQSEINQGQFSNGSGKKSRLDNISRCLQARAESRANNEGAMLSPKLDQGSSTLTTISNKSNIVKTPDTKVTKRRITPTPVKDERPICSFENILEKTNQSSSFSNISIKSTSLHLTHEGEIPVLHLEDNHFSNLPMDTNINDKNIMTLLDTMNISNIECELPKFKSVSNESVSEAVSPFSSSFTFENIINKATSTPIVPKSESKETINNSQNSAVESISSSTSNTSINTTAPSVTSSFTRRRRRCRLVIKD